MNDPTNVATVVTALYNIGRDNLAGRAAQRSFAKYLDWFKELLSINVPMVIFIPENLHSYIREHRPPEYATKVVIREFEDLAAYRYQNRIQATLDAMRQDNPPSYFFECPEFITAKYQTVIYSKVDFLAEVAAENPYNSDYFIWLDAGTFRNQGLPFDHTLPWPNPYKIRTLGDRFLIPNQDNFDPEDKAPLQNKRDYLRTHRNQICAYMLGGTKVAVDRTRTRFWAEVENALSLGVINNDQYMLQLMIMERPEDYYLWHQTRHQHSSLPIPLRDRMITIELAVGTVMGERYAIDPNVKLLAVATREVPPHAFARWESTAKHYGYNYEMLARDRPWKGFGTKIQVFHDRLQTVEEPYTVLTDCTDVFFCGSATELLDKFIRLDIDVIVGNELEMHYPGNTHDKAEIQSFFDRIRESPQCYPNSGFIMGKTESVRQLMALHLGYADDQVACFDTIYENKFPLKMDYHTVLVGNIPNYGERMEKAVKYFQIDEKTRRYRNVHSDEYPVVLHFPGKNWGPMQEFYMTNQHDVAVQMFDPSSSAGWVFLGIILLLIIIGIIVYIVTYRRI